MHSLKLLKWLNSLLWNVSEKIARDEVNWWQISVSLVVSVIPLSVVLHVVIEESSIISFRFFLHSIALVLASVK